ncbi:MAG: Hsp20/alpha crystallin family protein [Gammaproteobacteria bacterium]|nr:Hsp20/alpha crystallin family protein [Gammaproteobacteria bacterium]MDH3406653.1 Hsp20/alpha crystallin family protein [Gammaproteobacteria bacterium]
METTTESRKTEGKGEQAHAEKGKEIQKATSSGLRGSFEEMDRMFDNFMQEGWMRPWGFKWPSFPEFATLAKLPKIDVIERDNEVVVRAEVPGVDKKDLDISVSDNTLTIKGSTRHEEKQEKGDYYRHEISTHDYNRMVALPTDVDGTKAKASFKDGMLELTLPKTGKVERHSIKLD